MQSGDLFRPNEKLGENRNMSAQLILMQNLARRLVHGRQKKNVSSGANLQRVFPPPHQLRPTLWLSALPAAAAPRNTAALPVWCRTL